MYIPLVLKECDINHVKFFSQYMASYYFVKYTLEEGLAQTVSADISSHTFVIYELI